MIIEKITENINFAGLFIFLSGIAMHFIESLSQTAGIITGFGIATIFKKS